VPEAEEGWAEAELQYVEVIEDTEGTQANPADEGKPQCINLSVLKSYVTIYGWLSVYVQELKWNHRCMIPRYLCPLLVR
jgi:hypothetical protein